MRKLLLAILLFQAVNAFAQTVSAEIESDPLPSTNLLSFLPAPAIAAAKDRTGVAIAWLMPGDYLSDRISVVRLDATGHFAGQVQAIPTIDPSPANPFYVVAASIAAAPNGDGFTVAWVEIVSFSPAFARAAYCRLDRNLKPSAPTVLTAIADRVTAQAIVRSGKTTWITAGASAWELRDDGSLSDPLNAGVSATDMTVATAFPQIVGRGQLASSSFTCDKLPSCSPAASGPFRGFCTESCRKYQYTYLLQFTSLYSASASTTIPFATDAAPAIGSNGRDVAVVWLNGASMGGDVVMSRVLPPSFTDFPASVSQSRVIGSFGPDAGPTRADIASDGDRYVVVWRTGTIGGNSHDIAGASIDRAGNILPLSIAASAADERDPGVVSMGHGTFVVTYEKLQNGDRRIAGRIVTFESRVHAVR